VRGILADPEKVARPGASIDGKSECEPVKQSVDRLLATASAEHQRSVATVDRKRR